MMYNFRRGTMEDVEFLRTHTTENNKCDDECVAKSDEIRVLEYGGKPIMIIGAVTYTEDGLTDTLGIWGMFSKDIKKHTKAAVQYCKDLIFSRVNTKFIALIDERNPVFVRFVEHFGFKRTKVVEENDGTVYHLYVKVN